MADLSAAKTPLAINSSSIAHFSIGQSRAVVPHRPLETGIFPLFIRRDYGYGDSAWAQPRNDAVSAFYFAPSGKHKLLNRQSAA